MNTQYSEWGHADSTPGSSWTYVLPPVLRLLSSYPAPARVLDLGCGNGYLAGQLLDRGYTTVGVDLSTSGIEICRRTYPKGRFELLRADADVLKELGEPPFDVVVSTETIEHLYDPKSFVRGAYTALRPGGRFIVSTPYHGYVKNLALALTGKWDEHLNPMWNGGHIKFWSRRTLSQLLQEHGFGNLQFLGAGRAPLLWMSMVMSADKSA
jgi:2-polyprenyl-6-hydroxyphenyl methylase/3-demethylubiquinone-9 3-methyltransferase